MARKTRRRRTRNRRKTRSHRGGGVKISELKGGATMEHIKNKVNEIIGKLNGGGMSIAAVSTNESSGDSKSKRKRAAKGK